MHRANDHSESLLVHFRRVEDLTARATRLVSVDLNKRQLCDLELLLNRAYYPLTGYLGREDYQSVLESMRLADGAVWPLPVCLDLPPEVAGRIEPGQRLALRDGEGFVLAVMQVEELWRPDLAAEARALFGSDEPADHPGARELLESTHPWYAAGPVEGLNLPQHYDFRQLRLAPADAHRRFQVAGWRKVIAYHTDRPLFRAELEMTQRAAHQAGAHIFLHPVVGLTDPGDIYHYARVRCYQRALGLYPKNFALLGVVPLRQRWAGPREALFQAVVRKNFGCSHFMVADDQAGPPAGGEGGQRRYPPRAAYELLAELAEETGIQPVRLEPMVYVEDRAQHLPAARVEPGLESKELGLDELRRRLEYGLEVPEWFAPPEVVEELRLAYPPRHRQGFTVFLTGLSGSGKSTLAKVLVTKFMEMRDRPVTLLDGDIVRKHLSSELSFSEEHRHLNIVRIGFVASEITKNGGIAICAPIAPFARARREVREMISAVGGYVEVHVATPLPVCEERDRKGMYAKARAGLIKGYTGIDSPYEEPESPELRIDTSELTPEEAAQEVLLFLAEQGYTR
jgi:sulfate adenylyltransferase